MRVSIVIVLLCLFNLARSESLYTRDQLAEAEEAITKSIDETKYYMAAMRVAGSPEIDEIDSLGNQLVAALEARLNEIRNDALEYLF